MRRLLFLASTAAALQGSPPLPAHLQAIETDLRRAHTPSLNREMNALFEAIPDEIGPANAKIVAGAIPRDLKNGALLRNGPNARRWGSKGGWLDGDGMVHACVFSEEPRYSRRWLRTEAFAKEEAAGGGLFDGSLVAPFGYKLLGNLAKNLVRAKQPQKDTANTALLALKRGSDSEQKMNLNLSTRSRRRRRKSHATTSFTRRPRPRIDGAVPPLRIQDLPGRDHRDRQTGKQLGRRPRLLVPSRVSEMLDHGLHAIDAMSSAHDSLIDWRTGPIP